MEPPAIPDAFDRHYELRRKRATLLKGAAQTKAKYDNEMQAVQSSVQAVDDEIKAIKDLLLPVKPAAQEHTTLGRLVVQEHSSAKDKAPAQELLTMKPSKPDPKRLPVDVARSQMVARPGFTVFTGFPGDPLVPGNHTQPNSLDIKLSADYSMIVKLPGGNWTEIWCHLCGANAGCSNQPGTTAVHLTGIAGLNAHLAARHGGLNTTDPSKPWTRSDALAACGKHILSEEELRGLCEWRLTTNKVAFTVKSVFASAEVTKRSSAFQPPTSAQHAAPNGFMNMLSQLGYQQPAPQTSAKEMDNAEVTEPLESHPSTAMDYSSSCTLASTSALGKRRRSKSEKARNNDDDDNIDVAPANTKISHVGSQATSENIRYTDGSDD